MLQAGRWPLKRKGTAKGAVVPRPGILASMIHAPDGCVYCYAVRNRPLALDRYRQHDATSEFLFPPPAGVTDQEPAAKKVELPLFDGLA